MPPTSAPPSVEAPHARECHQFLKLVAHAASSTDDSALFEARLANEAAYLKSVTPS